MPAETPTVTIPDVEIVRAGNWASALSGRVPITVDDIAAMAAAAADPEVDHAPVKIGHVDPRFDGEPAFGWLTNIRQVGDRVIADIADVPRQMAHLVQTAFKRRSAEIAWGVKTPSGKTYKAALAGLALLGVTPPAVKGLADVLARYSGPTNDADSRGTVTVVDAELVETARAALLAGMDGPDAQVVLDVLASHSGDLFGLAADPVPNVQVESEGHMTDDEVRARLGLPADVPVTDQLRQIAVQASDVGNPAPSTPPGSAPASDPAAPPTGTPAPAVPAPSTPPVPAPGAPPADPATPAPAPSAPPAAPPTTQVDTAALAALQAQAAQGAEAMRIINEQERERDLATALSGGRIGPSSVDAWRTAWDRDKQQTKTLLSTLPQVYSTVTNFSGVAGQPAAAGVDGLTEQQWTAFERSLAL